MSEGDVDRLVAEARRELHRVSTEPGWRNHWNDEGYTPAHAHLGLFAFDRSQQAIRHYEVGLRMGKLARTDSV